MGNDEFKKIKIVKKLLFQFKGGISILQRIYQLSVRTEEFFPLNFYFLACGGISKLF
jgi:hypothetical protein